MEPNVVEFYWQDMDESQRGVQNRQLVSSAILKDVHDVREKLSELEDRFPIPFKIRWLIMIKGENGK